MLIIDGESVVVLIINGEIVVVRLFIINSTKKEVNDYLFFFFLYDFQKDKCKNLNLSSLELSA